MSFLGIEKNPVETSERSEVKRPIAFRLESLNFCWVERLMYDVEKCKVISLA